MVNITNLLAKAGSTVGFSFGVRAWTEMEIRCIKSMYRLKLISSENNTGFKGLTHEVNVDVLRMHSTREALPKYADASSDSR